MRLSVTLLTLGYLTMMLMAGSAVEVRVLGMVCLQVFVQPGVTGTTDPVIHVFRIRQYMLGAVRTVTYQAVLIGLALNMGLVTVKAGGFHTVLCSIYTCDMAAYTAHFSVMLAGIFFHLPAFRIVMAHLAGHDLLAVLVSDLLLHTLKRNLQRCMRIGVTLQAVGECLTVLQAVTPGAFGHYFLVIIFGGYIGMELGMTLQTVKPVLAVAVLQRNILSTVT